MPSTINSLLTNCSLCLDAGHEVQYALQEHAGRPLEAAFSRAEGVLQGMVCDPTEELPGEHYILHCQRKDKGQVGTVYHFLPGHRVGGQMTDQNCPNSTGCPNL